jgi:PAS domain S-box-containing protein
LPEEKMNKHVKILLTDDNTEFSLNLKDILEDKGYEVFISKDGFSALDFVRHTSVDLVLMDIKMPVMNGVETYKKMKFLIPDVPVIMLTGFAVEELIHESLQLGVYSCLCKPLDFDELFTNIRNAVRSGKKQVKKSVSTREQGNPGERYQILIIDDNVEFAENLRDILTDHQYGVSSAADGTSAMELLRKQEFDLVLIDINLPDIFGLDLVEKMSALAPRQEYIIITGHGTLETAVEAVKQKKIVSFEMKPIDNHHLLSLINQIKERKNAADALRLSEDKFRTIVENGQPIVFMLDRQGNFLLSEGKSLSSLGLKPGEVVGQSALEMYKDVPEITKGINEALRGTVYNKNVSIGNFVFDSFFSPQKDENGNIIGVLGMALDITDRMHAEDALKESEKRYRLLLNSAPQPIFIISRDGVYQFMNSFAASMLGGVPEDFAGTTVWDHFKKEHADQHLKEVRSSLSSGPLSSIICLSFLNGKEYWFSSHLQPLNLESDSSDSCLAILYDITERKIAEVKTQQRLEAEKIASLISERFVGIADFVQAVDDTLCDIGQYCEASRTFLLLTTNILKNTKTVFDWVSEDISFKSHKKRKPIVHYERFIKNFACGQDLIITDINKIPKHESPIKDALVSMGVNSLFLLPLFAKGSLIGYWGMDNFSNSGDWTVEKFNLLVVISNIFSSAFHRRCVEQELSASEEIHRILLNASQEGLAIMDRKGKITEVSDITLKLLGYEKKEDLVGKNYFDLIPKSLHKIVTDIFAKTVEDGITQNVELEFIKTDKTMFSAEVSTTLIPEIDGDPKGFMSAIRDITHRKTIEKQLIHTERMAGIGEMAAGIAHEINQPLNTISLTLDNLVFSFKSGEMDKEYLETKTYKLFQNITRMRNIIDHVRTFSRQNDDYILGNFNVNDSIRNAVSMVSEQFKHKGINLILSLEEKIKTPIGNTYKFEQVILNLIINAKDALEEKKKHLQKDFNKTIEIASFEDDDTVYVEVKDNGSGIDPDKIDKVFLPFYTSKETGSGTGLGLSISFGIIKDMQGNIDVQSKLQKGTTIKISIPAEARKKTTKHTQAKPPVSRKNNH